jgi:hypothetical protein
MKRIRTFTITTLAAAPFLLAESPTWAERLHKMKTGAWPPGVEQRLNQEQQAREQARQNERFLEAWNNVDLNGDGMIGKEERQKSTSRVEIAVEP